MELLPAVRMSPRIPGNLRGTCDPLNFYCTNYDTSYGRSEFGSGSVLHPGISTHRSTGYQSNLRPAVYYTPNLDRKDNPQMGLILRNNYTSITNRDYNTHQHVTGAEPLPRTVSFPQSGYIKSCNITNPKSRTAKSVHFDTREHGSEAIAGILPRHRPLLFVPQGKGSSDIENFRHGPSFMSTEYKTRFTARTPHHPGSFQSAVIGAMENSGFTEGSNLEPITHEPHSHYHVPRGYHRVMGHSITKTDFLPVSTLQGREPLPALTKNSERASGFTRESDHVLHTSALYDDSRPGDGIKQKDDQLGQVYVGKKEPSGFSNNNPIYVQPGKAPPQHYLTNYNLRFSDPTPIGRDQEGWTRGGIQKQLHSGFLVNNEAHIIGI
ncbi:stabilizer of axonemal microtubules 4 [Mixophyes fleayi]|uniref:stabilizer of axonemal microtubules 4 n=1 Tax=Mixophyes fleayi TaxID=3061075 RepID=UPI003F4D715E